VTQNVLKNLDGLQKLILYLSLALYFFWWNRVITRFSPRMATQNAFNTQVTSFEKTVNLQRLNHIGGASWFKPARGWQEGRNRHLVKSY
jgi:hypothetical protein